MKLQKVLFLLLFSLAISACCEVFKKNCPKVKGCTDSTAINFDPEAEEDDGTCEYLNVQTVSLYGRYSNKNGNNPQYQVTDIPEVSHGTVTSYLANSRACIEINNVKVKDQDGIHHEIVDLEVQEKNGNVFSVVPNFNSSSTENTTIAIVLVIQQSLSSYVDNGSNAQLNQAKYDKMISFTQKLVEKLKENADLAKVVNASAQRNYFISIVGYGSNGNFYQNEFNPVPLSGATLGQLNQQIGDLPRLDNNFSALGEAMLIANDKINNFPIHADYKCIIAIGDGVDSDSNNGLIPATSALKNGTVNGVYCLAIMEPNYALQGNGEQSFTNLSNAKEDGFFQKALIVEEVTNLISDLYKNVPNNYNLKYERSTQTTEDIELRWVMTTKPKK